MPGSVPLHASPVVPGPWGPGAHGEVNTETGGKDEVSFHASPGAHGPWGACGPENVNAKTGPWGACGPEKVNAKTMGKD